jgi:hypothetical protein
MIIISSHLKQACLKQHILCVVRCMPLQAFDGALRGLAVGESVELQLQGGDWQKELLFVVPRDHPEIERLEGRYKK